MRNNLLIKILFAGCCFTLVLFSELNAQTINYIAPSHKATTPYGYVDIGPKNSIWCHFNTDRGKFYFNRELQVDSGNIGSYNENLSLRTSLTTRMTILRSNGNVGIGLTNPTYKLQVSGDVYANGGWVRVAGNRGIYFQSHGGGFYMTENNWIRTYGNKSFYHNTGIMRTDGTFQVGPNGNRLLVHANGNVGINTTSPNNKLDVNGTIRAKEVIVETGWSDFVFEDDYKLPTLEEEKQHIDEKGHLIGFESEEAMGGLVHMGDVINRQQQKIEEQMLHLINLNDENIALKELVQALAKDVKMLKAKNQK